MTLISGKLYQFSKTSPLWVNIILGKSSKPNAVYNTRYICVIESNDILMFMGKDYVHISTTDFTTKMSIFLHKNMLVSVASFDEKYFTPLI